MICGQLQVCPLYRIFNENVSYTVQTERPVHGT